MPTGSTWLLPVLNSSLSEFILCQLTTSVLGGSLRLFSQYMTQLPIVTPDEETQSKFELFVDEIVNYWESRARSQSTEREIDAIVFHLYGLSAQERKLVLDWLGERRESLGVTVHPDWRRFNALQASAGAWKDSIDGEQLKQDIRASREIRTRPVPRV